MPKNSRLRIRPARRQCDIEQIQQAKAEADREPAAVVVELPPARVGRKQFGARAQPHVGDARGRKPDVIAEGRGVDPLGGQGCEAGIEFCSHVVSRWL